MKNEMLPPLQPLADDALEAVSGGTSTAGLVKKGEWGL